MKINKNIKYENQKWIYARRPTANVNRYGPKAVPGALFRLNDHSYTPCGAASTVFHDSLSLSLYSSRLSITLSMSSTQHLGST